MHNIKIHIDLIFILLADVDFFGGGGVVYISVLLSDAKNLIVALINDTKDDTLVYTPAWPLSAHFLPNDVIPANIQVLLTKTINGPPLSLPHASIMKDQ